jgi:SET and MYND domain-containing protein
MEYPVGAPTSANFEVRQTPTAGRAVFATTFIPKGTLLWRANDLTLSVVLREYRREVCGQCFGYEHGRDLRVRDNTVGFAFCNEECQRAWREKNGELGVQAWEAVENLVRRRTKEDDDMVDANLPRPKPKEIRKAWADVATQAKFIRVARGAQEPVPGTDWVARTNDSDPVTVTRQHKKALQKAIMDRISPDVMSFCVSGLVWRHQNPEEWGRVLALASDDTPYHSIDDLHAFVRTYLHLLAVLPLPLLPLVTPENLLLLSSRDSHNSFGIRSLEDDGSEFFGYGCWPSASYFNHSCGPNVEKVRVGRVWEFRAGDDIEEGEELCITYLSGEERRLSRGKRMETLKKNWGFECMCDRCEGV